MWVGKSGKNPVAKQADVKESCTVWGICGHTAGVCLPPVSFGSPGGGGASCCVGIIGTEGAFHCPVPPTLRS
ncbi:hypothetical protein XENTR_v10019754 [Xenopus tropicalis]|nr:hypothetical protein XENTR_v10019754 [Xenopus tropicalis]